MDNDQFYNNLWRNLVILCIVICISITAYNMYMGKKYVENGYEKQTLQGTGIPQWVKVD